MAPQFMQDGTHELLLVDVVICETEAKCLDTAQINAPTKIGQTEQCRKSERAQPGQIELYNTPKTGKAAYQSLQLRVAAKCMRFHAAERKLPQKLKQQK